MFAGFVFRVGIIKYALPCVLLLVAASACPPHCTCDFGIKQTYWCRHGGPEYVVVPTFNVRADIDCQGQHLSCATFPSVPVSHGRTLKSVKLISCELQDSLACILEKLGATGSSTLRFENCSAVEGKHLDGVAGLKSLWITDSEAQKTLPLDAIAGIPTITDLRVFKTRIQFLPSSALNGQLQRLDLITDGLEDLPRGAFASFKGLKTLVLYDNHINVTKEGMFEGLDSLECLDLSRNPLAEVGTRSFTGASRLKDLTLHGTSTEAVRRDAFKGTSLETISIKIGSPRLQFDDYSLSNLQSLKSIHISDTSLSALPRNLLKDSKSIQNITMTSCSLSELPEEIFNDQIQMARLNLSKNKIRMLPEKIFWQLDGLAELDLTGNLIEELPGLIFQGLNNLKTINLDRNRLTTIPDITFNGLKNLITLTLRGNMLTLHGNGVEGTNRSPFTNLYNLQEIDLGGNLISQIFDDWRLTWIHSIKRIDLSGNRISRLRQQDIEFVGFNVTVDLRNNNITAISVRSELHTSKQYHSATFLLGNNPLDCNCFLHPFLNYTKHYPFPKFSIDNTQCATPGRLAHQNIQKLPLESLTCDLENCTESCSCLKRPETSTLEFDCSEIPRSGFLDPARLKLERSRVKLQRVVPPLNLPDYVQYLDLRNLSLVEVPTIPDTVKELDLRDNKLSVLPDEILAKNTTLYLAGNIITCDCWHSHQIMSLYENKDHVKDYDIIICHDRSYLHNIDPYHICDLWWATVIGSALAAIGVIAMIIAIISYYNYRGIVKYIYKQGWPLPPGVYEDEIDNKTFDVLISYSDSYEKFVVSKLAPILRNEGYTVCLRCVDWDVGDFLPQKVPKLVEKSRRIMVLLCNDYFESDARFELKAALINEKRCRRKSVFVVETPNLKPNANLDTRLETKKKLVLIDASFLARVKKQLPKKRKQKIKEAPTQKTLNMLMMTDLKDYFGSKNSLGLR